MSNDTNMHCKLIYLILRTEHCHTNYYNSNATIKTTLKVSLYRVILIILLPKTKTILRPAGVGMFSFLVLYETMSNCSQNCWIDFKSAVLCFNK